MFLVVKTSGFWKNSKTKNTFEKFILNENFIISKKLKAKIF